MRSIKKQGKMHGVIVVFLVVIAAFILAGAAYVAYMRFTREKPGELLAEYMEYIERQEYEAMYAMTVQDARKISKEEFTERNARIYGGIEIENVKLAVIGTETGKKGEVTVSYRMSFDTVAGEVEYKNNAVFRDTEDGYKLVWSDKLIFPGLTDSNKIRVTAIPAERGSILDRNGVVLAGKGTATSVGIVPGKLENKEEALGRLSEITGVSVETAEKKLAAGWVKEDSFVPVATIPKFNELDLMAVEVTEEAVKEQALRDELLTIPGVMLSDTEVRSYELGEAASHLIGYVQEVTAEDIEEHPDEGYTAGSLIGRSGMEALFEKELRGKDGHQIDIVSEDGTEEEVVAVSLKEDGEDIRLTIDSALQNLLYEQFREDPGCSAAMNPYTGEVLALVSTPAYDSNDFIMGMSQEQWNALNEDAGQPMYNRFRQVWCPGSSFKPIVAAIGLATGALNAEEDFGSVGLSWQKDESWGSYYVTTLHAYAPVILKNALIYSDNIYFARAALKIGADALMNSLDGLGFNQELPFEISMSGSQYSNTEKIETEIQLADSGYGQGQILVNPLHLASLYTAFLNGGNVIKPSLKFQENAAGEVWLSQAFPADAVDQVMEGLKGVVNDPNGTGYAARRVDIALAGKTGTAEIKDSVEDTDGTEIGWFSVFTTDPACEKPVLILSMVEDVKGAGGSGYVVGKDKAVLDGYLAN